MGATIFGTWMLATFSGIFAFSTIFQSLIIAIPVGIVYGLIIFNLDRFITSSMKKVGNEDEVYLFHEKVQNFLHHELIPALPRILIALIIGIAISKPLELKLFEVEIQKQIDKDNEISVNDFKKLVHENAQKRKEELKEQLNILENKIEKKQKYIDNKVDTLNLEIAGKIGRRLKGYGIRATRLDELIKEAKAEKKELKKEIQKIKKEVNRIESDVEDKIADYEKEVKQSIGFFDKMSALSNLIKDSKKRAIWWSNFLITCLIVLIETAPVLVKLISSRGPYDAELDYINKKTMIEKDRELKDIKYKRKK